MCVLSIADPPLLPVSLAAAGTISLTELPGGICVVREDGEDCLRMLVMVNGAPSITNDRIFTVKAADSRAGEMTIETFVEVNGKWVEARQSKVVHPADPTRPVVGNFDASKRQFTTACKVRAQGRGEARMTPFCIPETCGV